MPPKVQSNSSGKAQTSLFSFFQKPKAAEQPVTVVAETTNNVTQKQEEDIPKKIETAKVSPVKPSPKEVKDEGDSKRRKTIIYDDDEDDEPVNKTTPHKTPTKPTPKPTPASKSATPASKNSASKPAAKKAKTAEESEEEWDGADSDEASASGASQGDESFVASDSEESSADSDDDDSSSDGLVDSDEEEEEVSRKKRPRSKPPLPPTNKGKNNSKSNTTSSTPSSNITPAKAGRVLIPFDSGIKTPGSGGSGGGLSAFKQSNSSLISPQTSRGNSPFFGTPGTPNSTNSTSNANSTASTPTGSNGQVLNLPEGVVGRGSHEHNQFSFLLPENRRDGSGIKFGAPGYNPRTLTVPKQFLDQQTPAMAQWWQFKSVNMDTVLFFKVGKFYELFHMDADIGFSDIDLIYMKGTKAHSGFPEISYGKYASQLVAKGHRVARVEQTETPEMLKERNDSSRGKKDKVVARELCSVMSSGTRTYCHLDDLSLLEEGESSSSVLVCVKEVLYSGSTGSNTGAIGDGMDVVDTTTTTTISSDETTSEYGVCIIDTVLCTITLAQFADNKSRTRLRTLLARYKPNEVLLETDHYTPQTVGVVQLLAPRAKIELLAPETEMFSAQNTLKLIQKGQYFGTKSGSDSNTSGVDSVKGWPAVLKAVYVGMEDGTSRVVCSALGGALWQLRRSLIDYEVLSLGKVYAYIPPDETSVSGDVSGGSEGVDPSASGANVDSQLFSENDTENHQVTFDHHPTTTNNTTTSTTTTNNTAAATSDTPDTKIMTLDEVALTNLEILYNNYDRTEKGSLWAFINHTRTPFGKRLLRSWLCHPLYRVVDIVRRQDAVAELITLQETVHTARNLLRSVPDLERLLTRVHSNGLKNKGPVAHPDSRAILYENYNTRKIRDFADVLTGFEALLKVVNLFHHTTHTSDASTTTTLSSPLLQLALHSPAQGGKFDRSEITDLLTHFRSIFDEKSAKRDGFISPRAGMNPDYDAAKSEINGLESKLEGYLKEMKNKIGVSDLKYWGSNKDRYQIEVPIALSNRVPANWVSKSQKKTHRRYWTAEIEMMLAELTNAEERLNVAQKDTLRAVFAKFDGSYAVWSSAISCVSLLDALCSVAVVSGFPNYTRPVVYSSTSSGSSNGSGGGSGVPELSIVGGRHPMLEFSLLQRGEGDCIPNDLHLGGTTTGEENGALTFTPRMLILSGPNMGGKSTLLRQTCLIAVMAQIGCYVPADSCVMTPVDRIFTRVGASDRILAGQSTFFVELAETAMILSSATQHSLCILDELGRGTATFDGTAIAHAVVEHLVGATHCRALFATHYHSLVNDWELDPRVRLGHMDCLVQGEGGNGEEKKEERGTEEVTFLYKLSSGSSPRSYGINVARLAGLPQAVVELALRQSRAFEDRMLTAQAAHGGGNVVTGGAGSCAKLTADQVSAVFERLVSIARSTSGPVELAYVAAELWRRFESIRSAAV